MKPYKRVFKEDSIESLDKLNKKKVDFFYTVKNTPMGFELYAYTMRDLGNRYDFIKGTDRIDLPKNMIKSIEDIGGDAFDITMDNGDFLQIMLTDN